jgi:predicted Zn finger-like uncharacterized protein
MAAGMTDRVSPGPPGRGMIVSCPACGARYRYDESRFEGKATKKLRCTKCETAFDISNPAVAVPPRPAAPLYPPPIGRGETTRTLRSVSADGSVRAEDSSRDRAESRSPSVAHSPGLRMPAGQKLSLAVIAGPDAGKTFPVVKPRVVIGRAGSDLELSDAEISREHAAIEVADDSVTVFDLESTNGTYVGGKRVDSAHLDNYREFEIGGTTVMLIVTQAD